MNGSSRLVVPSNADGDRLDRFLAASLPDVTRSRLARWIDDGHVRLDGAAAKAATKLRTGQTIDVAPPAPKPTNVEPQEIPLTVLYEDEDMVAIDKPAGLVVHPAAGHADGTLVNALLARLPDLRGIGDELRPGIVHRLDRDTSGVLLVAKHDDSFAALARQISARSMKKSYVALVHGRFHEKSGTIERPIGRHPKDRKKMAVVPSGKPSTTKWKLREELPRTSLLDVELVTGRTHQIRVHLSSVGHPIVGDQSYGAPLWKGIPDRRLRGILAGFPRQALHAARIELAHPRTGAKLVVEAPLPEDFAALLADLRAIAST